MGKERQSWLWTPRRRQQWSTMLKNRFWEQNFFMDTGIRMGLVRISQQWIEDARLNHTVTSISLIPHWQKPVNLCAWTITKKAECLPWIIASIPYFSQFFCRNPRNSRNPSFCWTPLYLFYHLNLVILAKIAFSPIFRNFSYCVQSWTYLLYVTDISGIRSLVTGSYMYH